MISEPHSFRPTPRTASTDRLLRFATGAALIGQTRGPARRRLVGRSRCFLWGAAPLRQRWRGSLNGLAHKLAIVIRRAAQKPNHAASMIQRSTDKFGLLMRVPEVGPGPLVFFPRVCSIAFGNSGGQAASMRAAAALRVAGFLSCRPWSTQAACFSAIFARSSSTSPPQPPRLPSSPRPPTSWPSSPPVRCVAGGDAPPVGAGKGLFGGLRSTVESCPAGQTRHRNSQRISSCERHQAGREGLSSSQVEGALPPVPK